MSRLPRLIRCHPSWFTWTCETIVILAVFGFYSGDPVPSVNEAHYLCKARHYWEPTWCARDLFLQSSEAHLTFYWSIGWLTRLFSLATATWIARLLSWAALALGWSFVARAFYPRCGFALASAWLFALLMQFVPMSGEWLLGGVEGKVFAYAAVLFGLGFLVRGRWNGVWPLFGLAAAFHVLVGGWAVVAGGVAWLFAGATRMPLRQMWKPLLGGFVLSLPGLIPALQLTMGTDRKLTELANQIYVFQRLPHHLLFTTFAPRAIAIHVIAMIVSVSLFVWLFPSRRMRSLLAFGLGASIIAVSGMMITLLAVEQDALSSVAGLLKFYWYRLSDVGLPIVLALVLARLAWFLMCRHPSLRWAFPLLFLMIIGIDGVRRARSLHQMTVPPAIQQSLSGGQLSPTERAVLATDWLTTCEWIRTTTDEDALFLTPRNQQTFKWYAQRAEVVNWKDVPQDADALVEWWQRMQDVYRYGPMGPLHLTDETLIDLLSDYDVDYLVVPRQHALARADLGYTLPYPKVFPLDDKPSTYEVYRIGAAQAVFQ